MSFEAPYSRMDRMLHNLAFSRIGLQKMLADMEDDMFSKRIQDIEVEAPVFITSLPRAGTTLLLEIFAQHPSFAAHTYRDMPFVLCPVLWDRLSRGFRKSGGKRARAHGDGMMVDFDTAEAFEEVAWCAYWPGHYLDDRIRPWTGAEELGEFEEFFRNHLRKIVALRRGPGGRYVSKNNANIARIPMLTRLFPDAHVVVPVRNPDDHVRSLMRQHQNFLNMHAQDSFVRDYMRAIGHFEFGEALRPIDMGGWLAEAEGLSPEGPDFWFLYWARTYETLTQGQDPRVVFLDYDRCCVEPGPSLSALVERLAIAAPEPFLAQASKFRAPSARPPEPHGASSVIHERAMAAYQAALGRAIAA